MDQEKKEVLLDEDTYNKMLQQSKTPTAPTYDDSLRKQQNALYGQIAGREPFQYDAKNDPLYGIYRDRYIQNGRMAMKDTMGQTAALTGGYGSSYGQAVGQQQYDAYLQGLTDVIPELYGQAYQQYQDEGDRLRQQYQMLGDQADTAYSQYRDQLGDWQYERAWQEQQDQTAYARQQDAYGQLYALIGSTGYKPTDEELSASGMSAEQANALRQSWITANPLDAFYNGSIDADQYYQLTGKVAPGAKMPTQTIYTGAGTGGTGGGTASGAGLDETTYRGIKQTVHSAGSAQEAAAILQKSPDIVAQMSAEQQNEIMALITRKR